MRAHDVFDSPFSGDEPNRKRQRVMFRSARHQVAVANRVLAKVGLCTGVTAGLGHASMRVPDQPDRFVVKGRGYNVDALAAVTPDEMIVCDLDGYKVDGGPRYTQCFEVKMHSCVYKKYPDVQAVVHAHPRFTVLMSVLGARLRPMCQEGASLVERPLPVYPHAAIVLTEAEGMAVADLLADSNAVLLHGHGATTRAATLADAVVTMVHLEEQARMNWYARCAAGPDHPSVPAALLAEGRDRVGPDRDPDVIARLDHFREPMAGAGGTPQVNGVWQYQAALAERELAAEGC